MAGSSPSFDDEIEMCKCDSILDSKMFNLFDSTS